MSVETPENIKARIWSLDTVEIRMVLRWLNNNRKKSINPTILASARHGLCHTVILDNYSVDDMEVALGVLDSQKREHEQHSPKPIETDEAKLATAEEIMMRNSIRGEFATHGDAPKPSDPITAALMQPMLAALKQEIQKAITSYDNVTASPRNEKLKNTIKEVMLEFGGQIQTKITALEDAMMAEHKNNLTILFPESREVDLGTVHKQQGLLIQYLAAGCHVFLTGPAGSGKSTAGEKSAEALKLPFGAVSCCSQDTVTKFMGYNDAEGHYHTTEFRKAYEKGGVMVIDEMDAGNPNVLAVLNSALSNNQCAFPDGMVKRHKDFRCIATGNTWGTGKTIQYVGRNAIDAATMNRFVVIYWDYDENLETKIAGLPEWSKYVQACRAEVKRRGVNFLITPRASIAGAQALRAKIPLKDVIANVLFPNFDPDLMRQMPPPPSIAEV